MPNSAIYDTRSGRTVTQAELLDSLARADVVFVGEQHTDPATHRLELDLLRGLHQRSGKRLTLGMEMWERDVQPALAAYLAGKSDEAAFLKTARPWANYRTDYHPLVEYAKTNDIPILATNVPQALASQVGKAGLAALKDAPPEQFAASVQTPHDGAWTRFQAVMQAMGDAHGGKTMDDAIIARFYEAQCLRDETMAETIWHRLDSAPGCLVLHINGQFHSDYGDGIPRRVLWRHPLAKVVIVSIIPVADPQTTAPLVERNLADYVVRVKIP